MPFNVDDVVRKIGGTQRYKVIEVLEDSKYKCVYEPLISKTTKFVFKESELELVPSS